MNNHIDESLLHYTEDEKNALSYLKLNHPKWALYFESNFLKGRDKISQRLITSLYRENLGQSFNHSKILKNHSIEEINIFNKDILSIAFPKSKVELLACVSGYYAFNRIEVEPPFFFKNQTTLEYVRVLHPNEIMKYLLQEVSQLDNKASQQFKEDLINSSSNMTLSMSYQDYMMQNDTRHLLDIIENSEDTYLRSEQAVIEGHPIHPGAKLRKGLSTEDTFKYSSEFAQLIHLKVALIHPNLAQVNTIESSYQQTIKELYPDLISYIEEYYSQYSHFYPIIIHPWQYDEIIKHDYKDEFDQHLIVPIDYEIQHYSGLSFRTLAPKLPNRSAHIKLSTNVHITGEIRTLSEQTTYNGPLVSHIIDDILIKDTLFREIQSSVINEIAGIHFYNSKDKETIQTERSEQLGTLYRENIYQFIPDNKIVLIPSSFITSNPNNNETVVISLIKRAQSKVDYDNFEHAAIDWIQNYVKTLLDLALPLYVKYGIALEAHLQNAIVVFNNDGSIYKLYVRDFEGLRIDQQILNKWGYDTNQFHPKTRILTNSPSTVFNKFFYSTIQNHIGEIILCISKESVEIDFETKLWKEVKFIIESILAKIDGVDVERLNEIRETIFSPLIEYKCVTTMRLKDEAHHYTYINVNNPLAK